MFLSVTTFSEPSRTTEVTVVKSDALKHHSVAYTAKYLFLVTIQHF